jgi:hypothetical protein
MSYRFEAGRIYRMPPHFGPAPGPRQLPDGVVPDPKHSPRRLSVAASFLTGIVISTGPLSVPAFILKGAFLSTEAAPRP